MATVECPKCDRVFENENAKVAQRALKVHLGWHANQERPSRGRKQKQRRFGQVEAVPVSTPRNGFREFVVGEIRRHQMEIDRLMETLLQ